MAIAFVQQKVGYSSGNSVNVTFDSNNTAGNLLVYSHTAFGSIGSTTESVTDNNSNSIQSVANISAEFSQYLRYVQNCNGGANQVTGDGNQGFNALSILEYSGVATSSALVGNNTGASFGTAITSGDVTTSDPNVLLIAGVGYGERDFTAGTNYTTRSVIKQIASVAVEDRIVSSTGTYNATGTLNSNGSWGIVLAAFKEGGVTALVPNRDDAVSIAEAITPNLKNMPKAFN